ncbi:hypothetical protein [Paraburkholderia adhaesiva]|uniref:hypothetical protein n=1 Tax=Paraburkholderia adhaesiva TaxID=2883244 RepID=UPI001F184676|nr:hypothetical protein [Paraburkholderia adhaesiva]
MPGFVKISDLPLAGDRDGLEVTAAVQRGRSVKLPENDLAASTGAYQIGLADSTVGDLLAGRVDYVSGSIAELRQIDSTFGRVRVASYYAGKARGGGYFWRNWADTASPDNGVTIIVGSDGCRWYLEQPGALDFWQAGPVGDGVTDDAAALATAAATGWKVVISNGNFAIGIADLSALTPCDIEVAATAKIVLLNTQTAAVGITLNCPHSHITAYGTIDGNGAGRSAVSLGTQGGATADFSIARLFDVRNVTGETWSGTHPSGIEINGGTGHDFYIRGQDFVNNLPGQTGSPARLATVQGYADRVVGEADGNNCWIGVVTASTSCHLKRVKLTQGGLEALYNLNGTTTFGDIEYAGQYQAVVNEANLRGGRIGHTGDKPPTGAAVAPNGGATIALQNAGYTDIGVIQAERDASQPTVGPGTLLVVRSGNELSGPVRIGAVQGTIRPTSIVSLGYHGNVEKVTIENVDLTVEYDPSVMTNILACADFSGAQEFTLRNWNTKIVDVTGANPTDAGNYFQWQLPLSTTLLRDSTFQDVRVYLYQQDGVTPMSYPGLRIRNGAQPLVHTCGQVWETGIACMREATAYGGAKPGVDVANGKPTAGTWSQNKQLMNYAPTVQGASGSQYINLGWTLVSSGTPGTWVQNNVPTGT